MIYERVLEVCVQLQRGRPVAVGGHLVAPAAGGQKPFVLFKGGRRLHAGGAFDVAYRAVELSELDGESWVSHWAFVRDRADREDRHRWQEVFR